MDAHKALIHQLYEEVFNRGNLELINQLFAPNFIDHSTPISKLADRASQPMPTPFAQAFPILRSPLMISSSKAIHSPCVQPGVAPIWECTKVANRVAKKCNAR